MSQTPMIEPIAAADPMLPYPAVVRAIKPEAYGISTFSLEYTDLSAPVGFVPGQFNMIHLPGFGEVAISIFWGWRAWRRLQRRSPISCGEVWS